MTSKIIRLLGAHQAICGIPGPLEAVEQAAGRAQQPHRHLCHLGLGPRQVLAQPDHLQRITGRSAGAPHGWFGVEGLADMCAAEPCRALSQRQGCIRPGLQPVARCWWR